MDKFKIDDVVRIVRADEGDTPYVGETGSIVKFNEGVKYEYIVRLENHKIEEAYSGRELSNIYSDSVNKEFKKLKQQVEKEMK